MLNNEQMAALDGLLTGLTRDQHIWLAGYIQGRAGVDVGAAMVAGAVAEKPAVDIYYATETGNSKGVSLQLMKALKGAGYKVKNHAVNRVAPGKIATDHVALFIASTHGEGDPPEAALGFFEALSAAADNILDGLRYAILGLGDSSYEIYCGAAVTLDEQLTRLGATSLQAPVLMDVDFAKDIPGWIDATLTRLNDVYGASAMPVAAVAVEQDVRTGKGYTRLAPVEGVVREIINLNDRGSNKETYHIEITYDAPVIYSAGDAAGIIIPGHEDVPPRLYSIASAPSMHEGEVHLTVALARHVDDDGAAGVGLASGYLATLKTGDMVQFYIAQNQLFNLPADDVDAIMIGPGTGIAPFRSFVYERSERGASGRNWLLFGDQHAHCDFLYQAEWQEHLATDSLHCIDLAFSRDQDEKVYVQHKLNARAGQFMDWLDGGASVFICGAKDPMSRDVEATIIDIIADAKGWTSAVAADYVAQLEEDGRYVKDVY